MATLSRIVQRTSRCLVSTARARAFHSTPFQREQYSSPDLQTFNKIIGKEDRLILVDFYADWCGPCHALSPLLERLTTDEKTETLSGRPLDLIKINVDDNDGLTLMQKFKIRAFPTVIAFRDGKPIDLFVGALNEQAVRSFLRKI